jgi:hypothetical protein
MQASLDKGMIKAAETCRIAQTVIEEGLYLQDRNNVYRFYRTLSNDARRNPRRPSGRHLRSNWLKARPGSSG